MAREDWVYTNLEKTLIDEVDKVVSNVAIHGASKYKDRKDFIVKAIQKLLDIEMKHKEVCVQ